MAKAPSFQWYPKDCDTDENVRLMDDTEFGFYMRCLNHSWMNNGLPGNVPDLARVMHRTEAYVKRLWPRVGKCFELREGRYCNPKQETQRITVREFQDSRRKGAEARWSKHKQCTTDAHASEMQCSPSASPSASVKDASAHGLSLSKPLDVWADELYERHPKKKDLVLVGSALLSVLSDTAVNPDELMGEIDRVHGLWCQTRQWTEKNGQFAPSLAKWILDHGWKKEPDLMPPLPENSRQKMALDEMERRLLRDGRI